VALTGDGGDELFGGYGKYRFLARRDLLERRLSRPVTQLVATGARTVLPTGDLNSKMRRYEQSSVELLLATLTTVMPAETLRRAARGPLADVLKTYDPVDVLEKHLRRAPPSEVGLVNAMRYLDLKLTLGAGILTKVDRASMSVSLETRAVYLHRSLLDIAARIPAARLVGGGEAKKLLRDALRPWLPSSVLDRPKMGFAMPLARWLRGGAAGLLARTPSRSALDEIIDPSYTDDVARSGAAGREERTHQQHSLLFLEHWLERWA
jgi:asparagine synthase (glutamine-hydrolysing)